MNYITAILLTSAISFISYGISVGNLICILIGAFCSGLYTGIINGK